MLVFIVTNHGSIEAVYDHPERAEAYILHHEDNDTDYTYIEMEVL